MCEKRRKRRQQFRHDPAETIGFLLFLQNCYSFCYRLVSTGLYPVIRNNGQDEKEAYHEGNIGNKRSGEILRLRRKSGKAIDHTDIRIEPGEFAAVVGRSGSGKSTLLHMLGGLDRPDSGQVLVEGKDIFRLKDDRLAVFRRRKIGFVFQSYNLVPSLNVWENIVLPIGLDGRKVDRDFVMDLVERIGMEDRLRALPGTLSGGQQQRVAIARALASRPAIILADEPTGNLDSRTEIEVVSLLKNCVTEYGQTLVMITHDETIAQMADRMIVIEDGKVVQS